jgi:hypothetical protein
MANWNGTQHPVRFYQIVTKARHLGFQHAASN